MAGIERLAGGRVTGQKWPQIVRYVFELGPARRELFFDLLVVGHEFCGCLAEGWQPVIA